MAAPEVDPTGFKRVPGQRIVPIGRDADGNPSEFLVGSGPALTDAELRASPVPVQLVSEPTIEIGKVDQGAPGTSPWPVIDAATGVLVGSVDETAPVSDIASSGLNGRLQRIAQRLASLIGLLPGSLGQKTAAGSLAVVLPSDGTLPLPTGAATSAKQDTLDTDLKARLAVLGQGPMSASAPVTIASDQTAVSSVLSTVNSSITPLNNGITFTGTSESTLVYEGASVAVYADQPGTLQVQQSPNGTDWDINELFNVPALGFSTPINFRGAFFRVIFTNNSGSDQTAFRLQTVKRPILNAMQAPAAHGVTLQNGVSGVAVGSNLGTSKYATALVQLTITGTATVTFQASNDGGVTWTAINAHSLGTDVIATTATASGLYRINCVGLMLVRANVTARVSGTITAVGYASVLPPAFSSIALASRSNIIGQVGIDQTTPGTTNAVYTAPAPQTSASYRSNVSSADVLAAPGALTTSTITGGSLTNGQTYQVKVVGVNTYGRTTATTGLSRAVTTPNQTLRIAFAQLAGATAYDVYVSNDADPKFVGRISEAQRASGIVISAQDTTSAGGTAGAVDVQVSGTGLLSGTTAAQSTAFVMPSAVNCAGYQYVDFDIQATRTGDDISLSLVVAPFFQNSVDSNYYQGQAVQLVYGGNGSQYNSNLQSVRVEARGKAAVALVVMSIAGTGAAINIQATKN